MLITTMVPNRALPPDPALTGVGGRVLERGQVLFEQAGAVAGKPGAWLGAELLFCLGVAVWRMMCRGGCRPATVTKELLDWLERRKEKDLERLVGKGPGVLAQAARNLITRSRQPDLLRYVVEALMEEGEPGCIIRPDAKGLMVIRLMTVIEALDSSTRGRGE